MRKVQFIFLILLSFSISFGAEGNSPVKHNGFSLTSIEKQIHYTNQSYELNQVVHNGVSYTKLDMNDW